MESEFISTMALTFELAAVTTVILLLIGIPLAAFLAFSQTRFKSII